MKKIMMVGKISSGKTTLSQCLCNKELQYQKTQAIELIEDWILDTPGEYLEQRNLYRALVVTAVEADTILLVQDATDPATMFPPQIAGMFPRPVVGVVTKSDLAEDSHVERAIGILRDAGAEPIFVTSSVQGVGCAQLYAFLQEESSKI